MSPKIPSSNVTGRVSPELSLNNQAAEDHTPKTESNGVLDGLKSSPYIKGTYTKLALKSIEQRSPWQSRPRLQPTVDQLASQLDKLKTKKGIEASIHGNILKKLKIEDDPYFEYYPHHVMDDLIETAAQAHELKKPVSRQYPMSVTTDRYGRFIGFEGTNLRQTHIETFIVTPHGAALQAGPFHRSRFLLDEEIARKDALPKGSVPTIKVYNADFSSFIKTSNQIDSTYEGQYFKRPEGSIYYDEDWFVSPQSSELDGACGTLGNLWIKGLSENDGAMLSQTLLVDIPGTGKGFFLPPPVCLRYAAPPLYFKIAAAMMASKPVETVMHHGKNYQVTTLEGLMNLGITVKVASDGKALLPGDVKYIGDSWSGWHEWQEREWRDARDVNERNYALEIKTMKQAGIKLDK